MKYLILGGTGTLGRALTQKLLEDKSNEVICFSRCELKQKEMRGDFKNDPRLHFILGDIRDHGALRRACVAVDTVFHVAALKHVDVLEENPEESVKTNIIGTMNVADAAELAGVSHVVFSSTDKAVSPVNAYGMSKAISEKILLNRNQAGRTHFSVFRWGNVTGSRGSVLHAFAKSLTTEKEARITHPEMTRFWITIEDAVEFMLANYKTASGVMIPPIKAASVANLIKATAIVLGVEEYKTVITGVRPGEKLHESLDEHMHSDDWELYTMTELVDLVGPVLKDAA